MNYVVLDTLTENLGSRFYNVSRKISPELYPRSMSKVFYLLL